jgi:hypothetical protein
MYGRVHGVVASYRAGGNSFDNRHALQPALIFLFVVDDVTNYDLLNLIREPFLNLTIHFRISFAGVAYQNNLSVWKVLHPRAVARMLQRRCASKSGRIGRSIVRMSRR